MIPLLNLNKVPPPGDTENKQEAGLEELMDMGADTGKLASPTPEQFAAVNQQLDMSFSDRSGPISQPEEHNFRITSEE